MHFGWLFLVEVWEDHCWWVFSDSVGTVYLRRAT